MYDIHITGEQARSNFLDGYRHGQSSKQDFGLGPDRQGSGLVRVYLPRNPTPWKADVIV